MHLAIDPTHEVEPPDIGSLLQRRRLALRFGRTLIRPRTRPSMFDITRVVESRPRYPGMHQRLTGGQSTRNVYHEQTPNEVQCLATNAAPIPRGEAISSGQYRSVYIRTIHAVERRISA